MKQTPLLRLQSLLKKHQLDAFFVSAVPTITYLTSFSGFDNEDRNAFLLITKDKQYIFTHGIYTEAAQKYITDFTLIDIAREQPLSSSLEELTNTLSLKKIGFEAADLTYLEYLSLTRKIDKALLIPADDITETIRIEKSSKEIAAIRKACALGDAAFTFLLTKIVEGITEKELALAYEMFVKQRGATISFDTIVAFGSNGSLPHHIPTDKKLTKNNFIVLDFGVKLQNYCSDMTRTVFFGKADEKQKQLYHTVLEAQQNAINYMRQCIQEKKQIYAQEVDAVARKYIHTKNYPDMPHSLGHGIGLLVHERPRLSLYSSDILTKGMVFSVEPGIYIPDYTGVRIEDLVTITPTDVEQLTNSPKNLIELS